jgi:hypothetical protein
VVLDEYGTVMISRRKTDRQKEKIENLLRCRFICYMKQAEIEPEAPQGDAVA